MTLSDVLLFAFSVSGLCLTFLAVTLWLVARPRSSWARAVGLVAAAGYAAASLEPVPQGIARILAEPFRPLTRGDVPAGRTAVVVFGSGSFTQTDWSNSTLTVLDPVGAERTLEAARVQRLLDAAWVISSGGNVHPDDVDAPAGLAMADALVRLGVPRERIIIETAARNTRENALFSAQLLQTLPEDHVVLVTSSNHMRRALAALRAAGVRAIPAIANSSVHGNAGIGAYLPTQRGLAASASVARELLGLVYYRARGWAAQDGGGVADKLTVSPHRPVSVVSPTSSAVHAFIQVTK